jgi:hypothetical protein
MEQLPKIVTQRLQATSKAGPHPDPNLLTALVEKSLAERERVQVLEHIAQCANCRDIVALSLPEIEMARATAPTKSGWLSWRVLRWGAAAACVVVVGAAVSLHKQARMAPGTPRIAAALEQKAAAPPTMASPAVPAPAESERDLYVLRDAEKKPGASPAPISAAQQPARAKGDVTAAAPALSKQLGAPAFANSRAVSAASVPTRADNRPSPAPASQMAAAPPSAAKSGELDTKETAQTEQVTVAAPTASDQLADKVAPTLEVAQSTTGKAKDASQKATAPAAGMVGGAMTANRKMAVSESARNELNSSYAANLVLPRWTLSSDGSLQRSLDAGETWQAISVPGNVTFRALAAVGTEIWVGGAKGAFYHSSDAGEHWMQVKPVADGKPLTADIIGVEFTDARHGKLTTAASETWTTTDAGQTWSKK